MQTRCKAGDLAMIVTATNVINVGLIVRIVRAHPPRSKFTIHGEGFVWTVDCSTPMTWTVGEKIIRRKSGPVPDSYMRPIRGAGVPQGQLNMRRSPARPEGSGA